MGTNEQPVWMGIEIVPLPGSRAKVVISRNDRELTAEYIVEADGMEVTIDQGFNLIEVRTGLVDDPLSQEFADEHGLDDEEEG